MIFEALSPNDLKNKVIYFKSSEDFKNSTLFNQFKIDENLDAIIVVDECSSSDHDIFKNSFVNVGKRITLITLSHEISNYNSSFPTHYWKLEPLSQEKIKELLSEEFRGLPREAIDRISVFSGGCPRIAVLIANNYATVPTSYQGDFLFISDESLVNRLIAGRMDTNSERFKITKRVLMGLSLFEKIGYRDKVVEESKWLAEYLRIDWIEFQEIIAEQKKRGIVQGEHYIYITPFVLAVHLLKEWWEIYGNDFNLENFVGSFPDKFSKDMFERFISRFPYISSTSQGKKTIEKLLSSNGIFSDGSLFKTEIGGKLFLKLTEADPKAALERLKRTIGRWNKKELLEFITGRRYVIHALEKIVVWRDFFQDAARLLLALGEAENDSYANNASGVFASLFSPAPAPVAPTEASLTERLPVLEEAINSSSKERKRLALKAFEKALQSTNFLRMVEAEYQGGKPLPKLWKPKDLNEIIKYYKQVWKNLEEHLEVLEEDLREEGVEILLSSIRGLSVIHPELDEMARATINKMSSIPWIEKEKLIEVVSQILHYERSKMDEDTYVKWNKLKDNLIGSDFSSLLKRFVSMNLLEDYLMDSDRYNTKWVEINIDKLVKKCLENPDLLESEYEWLLTEKAKRGYLFGYRMGIKDINLIFLEKLIEKYKKINAINANVSMQVFGGYLNAMYEKDSALWEEKIEELSNDQLFRKFIPELTALSGMTTKIALNILNLAKNGYIEIEAFRVFQYRSVIESMSQKIFNEWIKFLLSDKTHKGALIALELFYSYYHDKKEVPYKLTLSILLHPVFWNNPKNVLHYQMIDYYWKEIALKLVDQYPDTVEKIAEQVTKYLGNAKSITVKTHFVVQEVLYELSIREPKSIWRIISKYLGPPIDERAFYLNEWLRGKKWDGTKGKGALDLFDPEDIWNWVNEDVEMRSRYLATFIPPFLFHSEKKVCLAREMLARYGDRKEVRRNFSANFASEAWSSSSSLHYKKVKEELLEFGKKETNKNVLIWIEEYVDWLDESIEYTKIEEERRGWNE